MPVMHARVLLSILSSLLLAFTAGSQSLTPLRPGDPISIELKHPAEDAPNVTTKLNVSAAGTIKMPYLDKEVPVSGLNCTELARALEQRYQAAEIYDKPVFGVQPISTGCCCCPSIVAVGGEVRFPTGTIPLRDGMRLYQAIMAAGGPTEFSDMRRVKLIRGVKEITYDTRLKRDSACNPVLQDGDTIFIPSDDDAQDHLTRDKSRTAGDSAREKSSEADRIRTAVADKTQTSKVRNEERRVTAFFPGGKISGHASKPAAEWDIFPSVTVFDAVQETAGSVPLGMETGLFEAVVRAGYAPALEDAASITLQRSGQETRYQIDDIKPGGGLNPALEWGDVIIVGQD